MPRELPGEPADLTSADNAIAATTDVAVMIERLSPVRKAHAAQALRCTVAGENVTEAAASLAHHERVAALENAALDQLTGDVDKIEAAIKTVRDREANDRRRARRIAEQEAARRRREVQDGLAALGRGAA